MPNKKGKRLVDVLDEEFNGATGEFIKVATDKFVKLFYLVKRSKQTLNTRGKYNTDIDWCREMLDKVGEGTKPTKRELETANQLWKQYK